VLVGSVQAYQFADADAGGVEELHQSAVAQAERGVSFRGSDQG
jgi:hypothetical protein